MRSCGALFVLVAACGGSHDLVGAERKQLLASWQGIWVLPYRTGSEVAPNDMLEIHDGTVTEWLGTNHTTGKFELVAPCLARLYRTDTSFHYLTFAFGPQGLLVGGPLGTIHGDRFAACLGETLVVIGDRDGCKLYGAGIRRPEDGDAETGTCTRDGARLHIAHGTTGFDLTVDGEQLVQTEHVREPAYHATSLDDAQAHR